MSLIGILYVAILCILIIYVIYLLLYFSFDRDIREQNEKLAVKLKNHKIEALINGSGINNIPNLNLVSMNPAVTKANKCSNGPVYIGTFGTDADCIRTCANASASVLNVDAHDTFIFESAVLQPGAHCQIGPRPMCNMRTSYALMTINSVVCRSKYPELVGGPTGATIVACNNRNIYDPKNTLFDYKENKNFSPLTTDFTDVDERLSDGSFRFRCKFSGVDVRTNRVIESPFNRFHPAENYCAGLINGAHPSVKTVYLEDGIRCDCGNFNDTRVKNIDPNDKGSQCSNIALETKTVLKDKHTITVPYRCFTLHSPIDDVGRYLPCPKDQFTRNGSRLSSVTIPYTQNHLAIIEHPSYDKLDGGYVGIAHGTEIVKED